MHKFILFFLLIGCLESFAIEPSWKFRTLKSEHFELIYREEQKELAKRYLVAAEQAHQILVPIFKEAPTKTIIYLQDDTDGANGLANFLPYPHMTVYRCCPRASIRWMNLAIGRSR